jgi:CheY-like chemotaxis protein
LVVGDEPQIRDVVHATLEAAHYDILEVVDGSDVLPRVASWRPDMVITDLVMP